MAIRFDKAYNEKIRRSVKNFNAKVSRAEEKGLKRVPSKVETAVIKDAYQTRAELDRRLKQLDNFNIQKTKTIYRVGDDLMRMTQWDYENLIQNKSATMRKVQAELTRQKKIDRKNKRILPSERTRYLRRTIGALKRDPLASSAAQLKRMLSIINRYGEGRAESDAQFYENFFDMLWSSVPYVDADEDTVQEIHDMLEQLSPSQLLELYQNEQLVRNIVEDYNKYIDTQGYAITDEEAERKNETLENLHDALPRLIEKYSKI